MIYPKIARKTILTEKFNVWSDLFKNCKNHNDKKLMVPPRVVSSPVEVQLQHLVTLALTENWPARGTIVRKQLFLSNFDSCYKQSWQKYFSLLDFDNYYKYPVMTPSCSSSWTTPSTAVWPLFETWDHEMISRSEYSNHSINLTINQFLFKSHQKRHARQAHLLQIYFRFTTAD